MFMECLCAKYHAKCFYRISHLTPNKITCDIGISITMITVKTKSLRLGDVT